MDDIQKIGTRLGDLAELPDELRKHIRTPSAKEGRTYKEIILEVLEDYEGVADFNEILVGIYRKFNIILTRHFLNTNLGNMRRKNLIFDFYQNGKQVKGVVSTTKTLP